MKGVASNGVADVFASISLLTYIHTPPQGPLIESERKRLKDGKATSEDRMTSSNHVSVKAMILAFGVKESDISESLLLREERLANIV